MLEELRATFGRLFDWGCQLGEFNGEPDHIHLLLRLHPIVKPSVLLNNLKTVSSRLLRRDHGKEAFGLQARGWILKARRCRLGGLRRGYGWVPGPSALLRCSYLRRRYFPPARG